MDEVSRKLEELKSYENKFLDLGNKLFDQGNPDLFPLDILVNAVMDRTLSIIFGFTSQIESNNYVCAAPLVRIHLDSLLRFYAAYISPDPHDFSMKVMAGDRIDLMFDKNEKKMTDKYLYTQLSKDYPWIKNVYNETSGFVHFSHKHISTSSKLSSKVDRVIEFSMSKEDKFVSDETKIKAIDCMIEITEILYEYIFGWQQTKKNSN